MFIVIVGNDVTTRERETRDLGLGIEVDSTHDSYGSNHFCTTRSPVTQVEFQNGKCMTFVLFGAREIELVQF